MSGTMIEISEDSDVGTEGERWFLISPGLRPQPGSPVWIFVRMRYLCGSLAPHSVSLKSRCNSLCIICLQPT